MKRSRILKVILSGVTKSIMEEVALPISNSRLSVRAKPNARKTSITKVEGSTVFIDIAAPPEDNKANLELLKFLRCHTCRSCRIQSGATSKNKIIVFG